jgi:hypothetical protein
MYLKVLIRDKYNPSWVQKMAGIFGWSKMAPIFTQKTGG